MSALPHQVQSHGAVGDGVALDTEAIQRTIDAAAQTGGTVTFAPGTYLTGSLFIKSKVTLHLDAGVTLLGSQNIADYPLMNTRMAGIEIPWPAALVNIVGQRDAAIVGEGCIDGDGKIFWDSYWTLRHLYEPRGLRWASDYDCHRPRLIQVFESSGIRIGGGLQLRRSGFWTVHLCYSQDVVVDGVTIRNNEGDGPSGRGPSTDGIDIDSSRRILIQNADIAVNDDALCIKAGRDSDGLRVNRCTEDVLIRHCIVRDAAAGITFGSETSGGFRNIEVHDITVLAPTPVGILFKSAHTRGGFGADLHLHDITMTDVPVVLRITMNWNPSYSYAEIPASETEVPPHWRVIATPVPREQGMARLRDVKVTRITARGAETAFEVDAYAEAPLQRFELSDWDIEARHGGHIRDAQGWQFSNCRLSLTDPITLAEAMQGLPQSSYRIDPSVHRRDVSKLTFEEQDKQ